ncbi:hypothetical protein [Paraburkholderia tropica]|uniref:hypothetical protein n=1 Tax=Paraburkholderia tropica TaxID=92647 RepID=UPI003D27FA77
MLNLKTCTKCKTPKPLEYFGRDKSTKDGLKCWCKACANAAAKQHHAASPDRKRLYMRQYVARNKDWLYPQRNAARRESVEKYRDRRKVYDQEYNQKNAERAKEKKAEYRAANLDRLKAANKLWRMKNVHKRRLNGAHRRAAQRRATVAWSDPKKIEEFYFAADFLSMVTGEWYEVDHMVPLLGPIAKSGPFKGERLVYGFHCESNLAIISASENSSKSNRTWPDMPEEDHVYGKKFVRAA